VAARAELSGQPLPNLWAEFCRLGNIRHNGRFLPPGVAG
jgi:hypothetical protein